MSDDRQVLVMCRVDRVLPDDSYPRLLPRLKYLFGNFLVAANLIYETVDIVHRIIRTSSLKVALYYVDHDADFARLPPSPPRCRVKRFRMSMYVWLSLPPDNLAVLRSGDAWIVAPEEPWRFYVLPFVLPLPRCPTYPITRAGRHLHVPDIPPMRIVNRFPPCAVPEVDAAEKVLKECLRREVKCFSPVPRVERDAVLLLRLKMALSHVNSFCVSGPGLLIPTPADAAVIESGIQLVPVLRPLPTDRPPPRCLHSTLISHRILRMYIRSRVVRCS